jgi:hypothetical protein
MLHSSSVVDIATSRQASQSKLVPSAYRDKNRNVPVEPPPRHVLSAAGFLIRPGQKASQSRMTHDDLAFHLISACCIEGVSE